MKNRLEKNPIVSLLLALVLLVAFLVRSHNLAFNSAFLDEAIYIVLGKHALDGEFVDVWNSTSWVGGFPLFYPVLSALAYSLFGLLGSRFLNVLLGTFAVFLSYLFTVNLSIFSQRRDNQIAGIVAATFFALSPIPIAFSRLAIYDALSFTLFFLGLVLLQFGLMRNDGRLFLAAAFSLFSSFLAKYFVFIYFPFLFLLFLMPAFQSKAARYRLIRFFLLPLGGFVVVYSFLTIRQLVEFFLGQTQQESFTSVALLFWEYLWFPSILAIGGLVTLFSRRRFLLIISLILLALIPLGVHLLAGNDLSAHQHSSLSLFFLVPLIGVGYRYFVLRYRIITLLGMCVVLLWYYRFFSSPKVQSLEHFWPDSTKVISILRKTTSPSNRILAEPGDVVTLALYNVLPHEQVYGPFVFDYQGKEGITAYTAAIKDRYFRYILLDATSFSEEDLQAIRQALIDRYSILYYQDQITLYQADSQ